MFSVLLLLVNSWLAVNSFRSDKISNILYDDGDPGQPLILTPYIEKGRLEEARNLSRVEFPGFPKLKSFSGFFTVDKTYDSNQFFWYFPAEYKRSRTVMLWLQGGPGRSSLAGLFNENGPLQVQNGTFKERLSNWNFDYHVIYIDNPVGTGFSFTNDSRGYCTNQTQIGEQLYSSMIQFFQLFPEIRPFSFYVAGEGYAGKYIPALAYTIHKKNPSAKFKINLKGLIIQSGWCDPINQFDYGKYLYQIGVVDWNQINKLKEKQNTLVEYIKKEQWVLATKFFIHSLLRQVRTYIGFGIVSINNYLQPYAEDNYSYVPLIQTESIRKAIHVGNLKHNIFSTTVNDHLIEDYMKSVAPLLSELLNHYRVLIYNGQLDVVGAYPMTVYFLRNLEFSSSKEYKTARRNRFYLFNPVTNELSMIGYLKEAGNLTELLVRNAGHLVSVDQPLFTEIAITFWVYS